MILDLHRETLGGLGRPLSLQSDGPCGDLPIALAAVKLHFRADRTRTRVTYVLRTRSDVPPEYADVAREGGTGVPEVVR